MKIKSCLRGIAFWVTTLTLILSPCMAHAACEIVGTIDGGYIVACTGMDTDGFCIGDGDDIIDGNDIITVELGAEVNYSVQQWLEAIASVNAIAMCAGSGNNQITNNGNVGASADANALPVDGFPSRATANAAGISTKEGDDVIQNSSMIAATATSNSESGNIFLTLEGNAQSQSMTTSTATSTGIMGGDGNNQVSNSGEITATVTSVAEAPFIDLKLSDTAYADVSVKSEATGIGILGEGELDNSQTGSITVTVSSEADAPSMSVNLGDSANADATTKAGAIAKGIGGSAGNDVITSAGTIEVKATADAYALVDIDNRALVDLDTRTDAEVIAVTEANATAVGIDADDGDDDITNEATITVSAVATTDSDSVSATMWAPAVTDTTVKSIAYSTGIQGGDGNDEIFNKSNGSVTAYAKATTDVLNVLLSGGIEAGFSSDIKGGTTADAIAVGIDAGDGDDAVTNDGTIEVSSAIDSADQTSSQASSDDILVTLVGFGIFAAPTNAIADFTGIDGGGGKDELINNGTVTVNATSSADALNVSVSGLQLDVVSDGDAKTKSLATATGIAGGDGDDKVTNTGTVTTTADSTASVDDISVEFLGSSRADASTIAEALATGIDGGAGTDEITNNSTLIVSADSEVDALGVDVKFKSIPLGALEFLGVNLVDAKTAAKATAKGIEGGENGDTITNESSIDVTADAEADSDQISVKLPLPSSSGSQSGAAPASGGPVLAAGAIGTGTVTALGSSGADVQSTTLASTEVVGDDEFFDTGTTAQATATGIVGGDGGDTITNKSGLKATGISDAESLSVQASVNLGKGGLIIFQLVPNVAIVDATTTAEAEVTGIDGGAGNDTITNEADIEAIADQVESTSTLVDAAFTGNTEKGLFWGGALSDATTKAVSTVRGIAGGEGDDTITNSGKITVTTSPDADSASVSATLMGAEGGLVAGFTYVDASTTAKGTATGIAGGADNDSITNTSTGEIEVTSESTGTSAHVGVTLEGAFSQEWSAVLGGAMTDGTTKAISNATGIAGDEGEGEITGEGDDEIADESYYEITNEGTITVKALPDADSASVSVTLTGAGDGLTAGFTYADSTTTAEANAAGINGGSGNETINNTSTGQINVTAQPTSSSASVGVTLTGVVKGTGIVGGAALTDGTTKAIANIAGIKGGGGNDMITNEGVITVNSTSPDIADEDAESGADSASVSVDLGGAFGELGLVGGVTYANAETTAEATAVGIDGGEGNDTINNKSTGQIDVTAQPTSSSASVGVTAQGVTGLGAAVGVSLTDGTTKAISTATGIAGGEGNDTITNSGKITVKALPDADSASVSVTLSAAKEGVAAGGTLADAKTTAQGTAVGIAGGEGQDEIFNTGPIAVTAQSESSSASVSVSAEGTMTGATLGVALSDGTTKAISNAAGIKGGGGSDNIESDNITTVEAISDVDAASVSVNLGGAKTGLVAGVAAADITTTAESTASGISSGSGDDTVRNWGSTTVTATSTNSSAGVTVNAGFAVNGAAVGAALADGRTVATSTAVGVEGGDGNDSVTNYGWYDVDATSDVTGASVAVTLTATKVGLAGGASFVDGENWANASAIGISGGSGDDTISADFGGGLGGAHVTATTTSTRTNVSVTGSLSLKGAAAGASFADASNVATAEAISIEGGEGNDEITNSSYLRSDGSTTANTKSVAVNVNVAVGPSVGFSGATATTTSIHSAKGISGGEGDDRIRNLGGVIESVSTANAIAKSITVDIAVASFGKADVTTTANASALGIDGGSGQDDIENTGVIDLTATSDVDATAGLVTLAGIGNSNAKGFADATVTGIDTGHGENKVVNKGLIKGTATVTADAISYDVTLGGGGTVTAGTEATATAVGIAGGDDSDLLQNGGTISLSSSSTVVSDSQSYEFVGVGIADADSEAQAFTIGIDGGEGRNEIVNTRTGVVDVSAGASATATDMSASFGITAASASTTANAFSTGLRGGNNDDLILNEGSLNINATTSTAAGTGQFSILGLAVGDALTEASANGINAGGGNDLVINEGSITVGSVENNDNPMAYAEVANATFSFTSISITAFEADAQATGVLGGSGDDSILNLGTIAVGDDNWMARSYGYGFSGEFFQILGLTSVATRADSVSLGIAGGTGNDELVNDTDGVLTVKAASYSEAEGAGDTSFGMTTAVASSSTEATATGISGGAGLDLIENNGEIDSYAHSFADAYTDAFVGWGSPTADSKADATATATGITAESGQNQIANHGSINATSLAETRIYAKGDSNIAETNSKATSHARSTALGILGGNDGNIVTNTDLGTITVTSTARTMARANEKDSGEPTEAAAVSDEYATDTAGSAKDPITAIAKGISLGSGDDTVINAGLVTVDAQSNAKASAFSDSQPDEAESVAGAYSKAEAWGIVAAEGSNWVENSGQLDITALADASTEANSYSNLDSSIAESKSEAQASVTGVQGNGEILNLEEGSIDVKARATTNAVTGNRDPETEETTATAKLKATATGITTASDKNRAEPDRIWNEGSITVAAVTGEDGDGNPKRIAEAIANTDIATNEAEGKGASVADAAGIRVGNNSAEITNMGDLVVLGRTHARLFASGDEYADAVTGVDEDTAVRADADGIEAGNGDNTINNSKSISVNSVANIHSHAQASSVYVLDRKPAATSKAGGTADATGIKVGDGNNNIINDGTLEVTAENTGVALSDYPSAHLDTAYAYAGAGDTLLSSKAAGLSAGNGVNLLENHNDIIVSSTVDAQAYAYSNTSTTDTNSEANAGGEAQALGIVAGGGRNLIKNYGNNNIGVTASANGYAKGVADENATANAGSADDPITAIAKGISLGSGDDTVINAGLVTVDAQSNATSSALSDSVPYTAKSVSNAYGKADAWGIVAGEGLNWVENSGQLDITALADVNTEANSYSRDKTSLTEANSDAQASATGVQGNGEIMNLKDGNIAVRAQATTSAKTGNTEEESEDTTATAKLRATAIGITTASDSNRAEPDRIWNEGSIMVEAVTGDDSSWSARAWVDTDDNDNKATAKGSSDVDAAGVRVGDNGTEITNNGDLDVIGRARVRVFAHSDTGSVAVIGVDDDTAVHADVTGIEGGNGNNTVTNTNLGSINVESEANTYSKSEASDEEVYTSSTTKAGGSSVATGIKVGDGDNSVENYENLEVTARSNGTALSTYDDAHLNDAFAYAGTQDTSLTSNAFGISAGSGRNFIDNHGSMTIRSFVTADSEAKSNTSAAETNSEASAGGQAQAVGITSGGGQNFIKNYRDSIINVTASASGDATGEADEKATANAGSEDDPITAIAKGISLGSGDDTIINAGLVEVDAQSNATSSASSDSSPYKAKSVSNAYGKADAWGVVAGEGSNWVENSGQLDISALADANTEANSYSEQKTSSTEANSDAQASATGVAGNGEIMNLKDGSIAVRAQATTSAKTGNTEKESEDTTATAKLRATATGITTASDSNRAEPDRIWNEGSIMVEAVTGDDSSWSARAYVDTDGNVTKATAKGSSDVDAAGIRVGNNSAEITNTGDVIVLGRTRAHLFAYADEYADAVTGVDEDTTVRADAEGIEAGNGDNTINNWKLISVDSEVDIYSQAQASSLLTDLEPVPAATSKAGGTADAAGIEVGNGENAIANNGSLEVFSVNTGVALSEYPSDSAHLDSAYAYAGAEDTSLTSNAAGISAGSGLNVIENHNHLKVGATVSASAQASSATTAVDTFSEAEAGGQAQAIGIIAADGENQITNFKNSDITVSAFTIATALSGAQEVAHAHVGSANDPGAIAGATGISAGDGVNEIVNEGKLQVTSTTTATATALPGADVSMSASSGSSATATGIRAGNGLNEIVNEGKLQVTSTAAATAVAFAGVSMSASSGSSATATGIRAGNGLNEIVNDGELTVTSSATATESFATATGIRTGDGINNVQTNGRISVVANASQGFSASAQVVGIRTGSSGDSITVGPDGRLTAQAEADSDPFGFADASVTGIDAGDGNNRVENYGSVAVYSSADAMMSQMSATGIKTGNGDDLIINGGSIESRASAKNVASVAITSGAGNDQVLLKDASQSYGQIDLGDGDDRLTLMGVPLVTGEVTGVAGTDTLVFEGAGNISFTPIAFENAVKQGAGTYVVASLPTMQRIEVNQGTLEINSDYAMANDSSFQTNVNGDSSHGRLKVNGTAKLAGDLKVIKGPGPYTNGTKYDIIEADTLNDLFGNVMLPAPTLLLSFEMNQLPDAVEIETSAKSFTTVAKNRVHWIIADYLDRVMPLANGDLSYVLGEIQNFSKPEEFNTAFSSLSPDSYDNFTRATFGSTWRYIKSLQQRMNTVRSYTSTASSDLQTKPILLAYNGSDARIGQFTPGQPSQVQGKNGLWFNAFGQWGDQDEEDGFTGFDYDLWGTTLGFDHTFGDKLMAGLSLGYSGTDIDLDRHLGDGEIGSLFGSLYGSYFNKNAYLEAAFSYGKNWYENSRLVRVGPIERRASSEHDGDAFSGYLGAGYYFNLKDWALGPFGSLRYVYLDEESFREKGAGGVSLWVDSRETDSLVSELGVQVMRAFGTKYGNLIPELSVAWSYDFDIDDRVITTSFAGSPGASFSLEGQDVEKHGATLGAGLTFIHQSGFSTSLRYDGDFRKDYTSHGVIGELRYTF